MPQSRPGSARSRERDHGSSGGLNSTLNHGSTIKFLKFNRDDGTPAVTLDRNADLSQLGEDYEEVDYNVEDIVSVSHYE